VPFSSSTSRIRSVQVRDAAASAALWVCMLHSHRLTAAADSMVWWVVGLHLLRACCSLQVFAKGKGRRMQAPMMPAGQMVSSSAQRNQAQAAAVGTAQPPPAQASCQHTVHRTSNNSFKMLHTAVVACSSGCRLWTMQFSSSCGLSKGRCVLPAAGAPPNS
jgi:hypothetical protein